MENSDKKHKCYFVEVLNDYEPSTKEKKELPVKKGNKCIVLEPAADRAGWLSVESVESKTVGIVKEDNVKKVDLYKAVHDRTALGLVMSNGEPDVNLKKGQKMVLLANHENDWITVKLESNGDVGMAPLTFLKKMKASPKLHRRQQTNNKEQAKDIEQTKFQRMKSEDNIVVSPKAKDARRNFAKAVSTTTLDNQNQGKTKEKKSPLLVRSQT